MEKMIAFGAAIWLAIAVVFSDDAGATSENQSSLTPPMENGRHDGADAEKLKSLRGACPDYKQYSAYPQ